MNSRALLLAGALLSSSALFADIPHRQDPHGPWKGSRQGLDTPIGKVWFNVQQTSDEGIKVRTLLPVELQMIRTRGSDNVPLGLMSCDVSRRVIFLDQKVENMFTVTVANCGGREYAVRDVLFALDDKNLRDLPSDKPSEAQ